jgi:hypothetical protein
VFPFLALPLMITIFMRVSSNFRFAKHFLFYIGTVYHIFCAYAISFNAYSDMNSSSPQ